MHWLKEYGPAWPHFVIGVCFFCMIPTFFFIESRGQRLFFVLAATLTAWIKLRWYRHSRTRPIRGTHLNSIAFPCILLPAHMILFGAIFQSSRTDFVGSTQQQQPTKPFVMESCRVSLSCYLLRHVLEDLFWNLIQQSHSANHLFLHKKRFHQKDPPCKSCQIQSLSNTTFCNISNECSVIGDECLLSSNRYPQMWVYFCTGFGNDICATQTSAMQFGPALNCDLPCSGDSSRMCGGCYSFNLYSLSDESQRGW